MTEVGNQQFCGNPMCPRKGNKRFKDARGLTVHLYHNPACAQFVSKQNVGHSQHAAFPTTSPDITKGGILTTTTIKHIPMLRRDFLHPCLEPASVLGTNTTNNLNNLHSPIPLETEDSAPMQYMTENDLGTQVGEENHPGILLNDDEALPEYIEQERDNPSFPYTTDQKWTVALLKLLIDWNAPDEAFGRILKWARSAKADNYSFYPRGGTSRNKNIDVLFDSIENAKLLLPSVSKVMVPHGAPIDVITYDFVPQLLSLLQNRDIMTQGNLLIDCNNPLAEYQSPGNVRGDAIAGQVYKDAYKRLITNPQRQLFVPIIQWIDRTSVTGNDRFSLKPYMFTPAIFTEQFRRTFPAWGYHAFLPKEKSSSAQNVTKRQGDNMRNYHAQLKAALETFRTADERLCNISLPIGPLGDLTCDIVTCILFVIQDIQEGDTLCGRYGPHTSLIQRQCRACDISYDDLDNPDIQCTYLFAGPLHEIAQGDDKELQARWSQHKVDNAFKEMHLGDPTRGIMGATPVDTMHVLRNGIISVVTFLVLENVPASKKAALDNLAVGFHKKHRQTCRKFYPATDFSNGITNLTKISAAERLGLVFLFVILYQYDEGWRILETTLQQRTTTNLPDILELFEAIICFDAWLKQPTYWSVDEEKVSKENALNSIRQFLEMCRSRIPTDKSDRWNFPKFHELLHIVDDISRFGSPNNFSAERPESLLIPAAKRPGRRAQKRHQGSAYELQAAQRLTSSFMIDTVYRKIWGNDDGYVVTSANEQSDASRTSSSCATVIQSTGKATFCTLTTVMSEEAGIGFVLCWDTKTNKESMTLPRPLLEFMAHQFGPKVRFCTEYRREEHIFRCHPCFQSDGPIYDWFKIQFDDDCYPCKLVAVVVDEHDKEEPYKLVVQSATKRTGSKSALLTEWTMASDYYVVSPETIAAPCFVIEITDNNSKILETLAHDQWANLFT